MTLASNNQLSIQLTRFFLKIVGFWLSNNSREQWLLDLALTYTIVSVIFGTVVIWMDFYYSIDDFYNFAYALTNIMTLLMVQCKLLIFTMERRDLIDLIRYSKNNFWEVRYDAFGSTVLVDCEKKCIMFVFTFTAFAQGTVCSYVMTPIIDNIGKNETDRNLPFNIWVDLPVTTSPYFEILFFVQTLSLYHVGILYFCFDNLLCILNIHVEGQFHILNRHLESICDNRTDYEICRSETITNDNRYVNDSHGLTEKLKKCLRHHQSLIAFVDRMEAVFTLIILIQVLVFSILICLVAYQAFLVGGPFLRRIIFLVHCAGTFTQLFMFTLTCHNLYEASCDVANAAYRSGWYLLAQSNSYTKLLRKDITIMIMRARRPCCLTACGFFPISLETFMAINNTAISYLTLLRQSGGK